MTDPRDQGPSGRKAPAPGPSRAPAPAEDIPAPVAPPMAPAPLPPPPAALDPLGPKAPPSAPLRRPGPASPLTPPPGGAPGFPRAPAASEVLLAPKLPPMAPGPSAPPPSGPPPMAAGALGPKAPPVAAVPPDPLDELSPPAKALAESVAGVASVVSSMELSWRLPDYLIAYWSARQEVLARDEEGVLEQDYVEVLRRAKALHGADATDDEEAALGAIREIADELDAEKVPYFAEGLAGDELRFLQAAHDLALALVHYKQATRIGSMSDRLVMLTSSTGAMGCLENALNRFGDLTVPLAVERYAKLLTFKIGLEEDRCRAALDA